MKHQQVVVDYWSMVKTSCSCLFLAFFGFILMKMVQAIFWLPGYLQNNQKRLEELAAQCALGLEKDDEAKVLKDFIDSCDDTKVNKQQNKSLVAYLAKDEEKSTAVAPVEIKKDL